MNDQVCKVFYPEDFNCNYIMAHYLQMEELKILLEKSGYKEKFIRKFRIRLKFLTEKRESCFEKRDWFEKLKGNCSDLCSLKVKGEKNIRILFTFYSGDDGEYVVLLVSFEEKSSKDYTKHITIAQDRLKGLVV